LLISVKKLPLMSELSLLLEKSLLCCRKFRRKNKLCKIWAKGFREKKRKMTKNKKGLEKRRKRLKESLTSQF